MIAIVSAFGFRGFPLFIATAKDPVWRWALILFFVSAAGLLTYAIEFVWRIGRNRYRLSRTLSALTDKEKQVLGRYLREQTIVLNWGRGGAVDMLHRDGVLILLVSDVLPKLGVADVVPMDTYAISRTTWKRLNAHPELVDLERRTPHRS